MATGHGTGGDVGEAEANQTEASSHTPTPTSPLLCLTDVGSVEGLAYHRGWDTLYWTSYTTSTITRHTVDQTRPGAFERETVITMSGDDHPRAFVLDECQK